jgi:hypothetical protein
MSVTLRMLYSFGVCHGQSTVACCSCCSASRQRRLKGLSRVRGNSHARFLEGWAGAIPPGYSTAVGFSLARNRRSPRRPPEPAPTRKRTQWEEIAKLPNYSAMRRTWAVILMSVLAQLNSEGISTQYAHNSARRLANLRLSCQECHGRCRAGPQAGQGLIEQANKRWSMVRFSA